MALPAEAANAVSAWWRLERETGIEPATNSLEGCDSTTELLPPFDFAQGIGASTPLRAFASPFATPS